jgi:hypothetical protein
VIVTAGSTLMPHWISEIITAIVSYVPAMIVDPDSPNFALIRTMFGLILIAIIVYVIAMTPFRTVIARSMDKLSSLFTRNEQR